MSRCLKRYEFGKSKKTIKPMKSITITVLVALLAACVYGATLINDSVMITKINTNPDATWTAKPHKKFEGKSLEELRQILGAFVPVNGTVRIPRATRRNSFKTVPKAFDLREAFPKCSTIQNIRNQESCGSCWAFSGAAVLSDRFCVATNGAVNVDLSPEYILECDSSNYGCNGGYLNTEWNFLASTGTTSDKCVPYTSGEGVVGSCPSKCKDGSDIKLYKADAKTIQLFDPSDLAAVQNDILTHGSVQMGFMVYQDFFTYSSGVYKHLHGGLAGGHAVRVVGWGVDSQSGLPYWTVANSWGEEWGMNGYFNILRGSNECDCESQLYSARPLIN